MANGDAEGVRVDEPRLQGILEEMAASTVATAAVGEYEDLGRLRIAPPTFPAPPPCEVVDRKVRCVVGGADEDGAQVGGHVVDAVRNREAVRIRRKVVIRDALRRTIPRHAGILEVADQLLLLGVNAHNGQISAGKAGTLRGDVFELLVAVGSAAVGDPFVIRA